MSDRHWTILIPVKRLATAKTRLREEMQRSSARLALAFARDTLTAISGSRLVHRAVVVTGDAVIRQALSDSGCDFADEGTRPGLNQAIRFAAAGLPPHPVAVLTADLPALRPTDVDEALHEAGAHRQAFVPDAHCTGTVLLAAASPPWLSPCFGAGSAQAHQRAGAHRLNGDWPSLRRDVDTVADLAMAQSLGVGRHTAALLHGITTR
jgi:2-phospho-L-lactate guanylyltransferase